MTADLCFPNHAHTRNMFTESVSRQNPQFQNYLSFSQVCALKSQIYMHNGLNVCEVPHPKSCMFKPWPPPPQPPMFWHLEMGPLKVIRVRLLLTSTLMMGLVALRGREWGRALYIHWGEAMWVHRDKVTVRKAGRKLSPEHNYVCTLISDFQPQNGEACSLVHLVYRYFFVTIQAKTSDRS